MRITILNLALTVLTLPIIAHAQTQAPAERGVYLTAFRSPATGVELRAGHAAAYAGYYPTVLKSAGVRNNANFIRAGVSYYLRTRGATPYISPSLVISLDRKWKSGALTEVGYRIPLMGRITGRLGAAVLTTTDRKVRVNPTVGLDIKLGGAR